LQGAGEDVPAEAIRIAEDLGDLLEEGVSPRVVAEHAAELARRLRR
jgi:hypothetical protein